MEDQIDLLSDCNSINFSKLLCNILKNRYQYFNEYPLGVKLSDIRSIKYSKVIFSPFVSKILLNFYYNWFCINHKKINKNSKVFSKEVVLTDKKLDSALSSIDDLGCLQKELVIFKDGFLHDIADSKGSTFWYNCFFPPRMALKNPQITQLNSCPLEMTQSLYVTYIEGTNNFDNNTGDFYIVAHGILYGDQIKHLIKIPLKLHIQDIFKYNFRFIGDQIVI